VERCVLSFDHDVTGEPAKADPVDHGPQQTREENDQAHNNEKTTDIHDVEPESEMRRQMCRRIHVAVMELVSGI
jgi:transposase